MSPSPEARHADPCPVSKGRGLVPSEQSTAKLGAMTLYSPENVHMLIFQWLNETFPIPGNRFVNGAQGGVGAGYFGWCFSMFTTVRSP